MMSEIYISLRSDHGKNYSHIAYVFQYMEYELSKNNNDYDNEDNVCNEVNHNMGMDGKNMLQSAECLSAFEALAYIEVVINDNCIDKKESYK